MTKAEIIEQLNIMLIDHETMCRDKGIDSEDVSENHDKIIEFVKDNL